MDEVVVCEVVVRSDGDGGEDVIMDVWIEGMDEVGR